MIHAPLVRPLDPLLIQWTALTLSYVNIRSFREERVTIQQIHQYIISNDRSFGCPITVHNAILFIDTPTRLDTTKLILQLESHIGGHCW